MFSFDLGFQQLCSRTKVLLAGRTQETNSMPLISGNLYYPLGEEITAVTVLLPGLPWDVQEHSHPQLPVTCILWWTVHNVLCFATQLHSQFDTNEIQWF
jgi:hypothetical protein